MERVYLTFDFSGWQQSDSHCCLSSPQLHNNDVHTRAAATAAEDAAFPVNPGMYFKRSIRFPPSGAISSPSLVHFAF